MRERQILFQILHMCGESPVADELSFLMARLVIRRPCPVLFEPFNPLSAGVTPRGAVICKRFPAIRGNPTSL